MKKIVALMMVLAVALLGMTAMAEGRTLTVQGVGVVNVDADRATVSLGVRETSADVITAQSTVNGKMDAVIKALSEAGLPAEGMSTGGIGIYPNYDYSGEMEQIVGYTAYNNLTITVMDVDAVGGYIDAAFAAGANSLDYVEFSAADTAEAGDQALQLAVDSAVKKAETLAAAAGVKLGEITEIRDNFDGGFDINSAFAATKEAAEGEATQLMPGRQQISATVFITYEIKD